MIPDLFKDAPLRELILPFTQRPISLLALKDACSLRSDVDPNYDVYWGEAWPAAVALADAIFSGAIEFTESAEPILEVGCGTGLVSIALAMVSSRQTRIVASDREYRALRLTEENARRNGVAEKITTAKLDWCEKYGHKHSLIIAGDCLYQADACWQLSAFLREALLDSSSRAYVVDPERWSARNFHFQAREAGLNLKIFKRPIPFVAANGPIREIYNSKQNPKQQSIEATFYELSIA